MIVVACNTASSVAIPSLVRNLGVPVVGVVKPAAREAFNQSKNKKIGVIGTNRTIKSKAYDFALHDLSKEVEIFSYACPLFVPLVEEGWIDNAIVEDIAKTYLIPLKQYDIDTLILGCTHYPLLSSVIQRVVGEDIQLIQSGFSTAQEIKAVMKKMKINNLNREQKRKVEYYVTDDETGFNKIASLFMSDEIVKAVRCQLDK